MKTIPKAQLFDYFILVARIWLAYILIDYGWGKLHDDQFGVTPAELRMPLQDLGLFRLSWYLADHQPFKAFIGSAQIIAALLLLWNRTLVLGAFMTIPIWLNILVWDISFLGTIGNAFIFRISWYLLLTAGIIWHYRARVVPALRMITRGIKIKFRYPVWAYLLIPVLGFFLDWLSITPNLLIMLFKH